MLFTMLQVSHPLIDDYNQGYPMIQEFLHSFLSIPRNQLQKLLTERLIRTTQMIKERRKIIEEPVSLIILQYLEILLKMRKAPNN